MAEEYIVLIVEEAWDPSQVTEEQWTAKLKAAGFDDVTVVQHRFPSGRLYVARKH